MQLGARHGAAGVKFDADYAVFETEWKRQSGTRNGPLTSYENGDEMVAKSWVPMATKVRRRHTFWCSLSCRSMKLIGTSRKQHTYTDEHT